MSPEHDDERIELQDNEEWEEPPRPFLGRTWVRVAIVVVVVGAIAAASAPFVMDALNPPAPIVARPPAPAEPAPPPSPPPASRAEQKADATAAPAPAPVSEPAPTPSPAAPAQAKQDPKRAAAAVEKREEPKPATRDERKPEKAAAAAKSSTAREAKPDAPQTSAAPDKTIGGESGDFWVQIGAFRDADTAKRVVAQLEQRRYRVQQSTTTRRPAATNAPAPAAASGTAGGTGDRYDVFVASTAPAQVVSKLSARGLSAESVSEGALVKPSLPLRDAVALSKDLASEGFKVQVRRARDAAPGGTTASAPAPGPAGATAPTAETLHRVRVGAFTDRATAMATLKKLEADGFKPFIAKEPK